MKCSLLVVGLILATSCTNAKSPSDIAKDACKASMIADPIVQQLVPSWGQSVEMVVNIICTLPNVIQLFETLPAEQAKQQAVLSVKTMASTIAISH